MVSVQNDRGARTGRATERALNGRWIGNQLAASADESWAVVICKSRPTLPAWLKHAILAAEGAATLYTSPRLPIVILHEAIGQSAGDLAVVPLSAFQAWFGGWRGNGDDVLETSPEAGGSEYEPADSLAFSVAQDAVGDS